MNTNFNDLFKKTRPDKQPKQKANKFVVILLFLGSIGLSSLLWSKDKLFNWWQTINQPTTYHFIKSNEDILSNIIGFLPNLKNKDTLKESINLLVKDLDGTYGIFWQNLKTGDSFGINENEVFTAASVNKVPIMVNFYQQVELGKLKADDIYVLNWNDMQNFGSGQMRYQPTGTQYQYSDLITLSGKNSDNTAAWILNNLVGQDLIQERLNKLGLNNTSMADNTTTPQEMAIYLVKLYQNKLINEKNKNIVVNALTETDFEDRITLGVPTNIKVAHKIGNEIQIYNDCGIIYGPKPYVLCILSKEAAEDQALSVIPKISRLIWEYINK